MGDNEGFLSGCGEQGYPVATLPGEQRRSGRKQNNGHVRLIAWLELATLNCECGGIAKHDYMYVQLECELLPNRGVAAAGSVSCTQWIVCRLSCGRISDDVLSVCDACSLTVPWMCHVMRDGTLRRPMIWLAWRHSTIGHTCVIVLEGRLAHGYLCRMNTCLAESDAPLNPQR